MKRFFFSILVGKDAMLLGASSERYDSIVH
jgi:hypothetical protein